MSYIPKVGDKVIVCYEIDGMDAANHCDAMETINAAADDGSWILLFANEPGEQQAMPDKHGQWTLQESGQVVLLLDPQGPPEWGGTGYTVNEDGRTKRWEVWTDRPGGSLVCHAEVGEELGEVRLQGDGTWVMEGKGQIFFISEAQEKMLMWGPPKEGSGD